MAVCIRTLYFAQGKIILFNPPLPIAQIEHGMLKKLLCVILTAQAACLTGQSLWTDISEKNIPLVAGAQRDIIPKQYRTVHLDLPALQPVLAAAPERFTAAAADQETTLSLPMPDGSWERFRLTESPVMASGLQAKYPSQPHQMHPQCLQGMYDLS